MANLVILTAEALQALTPPDRQAARRSARQQPLVRLILRTFAERGGPIPVQDIAAASAAIRPETLDATLNALDAEDLIRLRGGLIDIAYPFSAAPTPFRVTLSGGRERYACCAMDALGMAPMLGEAIDIRSRCGHCDAALNVSAGPDGPAPGAEAMMVWFGKRVDERAKVADSL